MVTDSTPLNEYRLVHEVRGLDELSTLPGFEALRTTAQPCPDGTYALRGTKVFITAGEHTLAENIVHLVLARLPDAPPGIKGISLFLVPKVLPDANGKPARPNAAYCRSIERKMRMNAACACVMRFEDATGWLLGEPHRGMHALSTMMNSERLMLSVLGPAAAETAYQPAVADARERLQMRGGAAGTFRPRPARGRR